MLWEITWRFDLFRSKEDQKETPLVWTGLGGVWKGGFWKALQYVWLPAVSDFVICDREKAKPGFICSLPLPNLKLAREAQGGQGWDLPTTTQPFRKG